MQLSEYKNGTILVWTRTYNGDTGLGRVKSYRPATNPHEYDILTFKDLESKKLMNTSPQLDSITVKPYFLQSGDRVGWTTRPDQFGVVTNITYIQGALKVVIGWYDNEDYLGTPKYKSYSIYYYKLITNIIIHHGDN